MHALLDRWTCTWVAVRRHLNKLADQLATCDRAVMGSWTPSLTVWVLDGLNSNLSAFPWHPQWEIHMSPDPLVDIKKTPTRTTAGPWANAQRQEIPRRQPRSCRPGTSEHFFPLPANCAAHVCYSFVHTIAKVRPANGNP